MSEKKEIPVILRWNIEQVKYILRHRERQGSGSREDWKRKLRELQVRLKQLSADDCPP